MMALDQKSVETESLTNAFGWSRSDATVQHDVQELNRVFFDAIEKVGHRLEEREILYIMILYVCMYVWLCGFVVVWLCGCMMYVFDCF